MAPTTCRGLLLIGILAFAARSAAAADWPQNVDVDSFVGTERAIALEGVLANIGPNGSLVPGAAAGLVVASPSKVNPDCQWPTPRLNSIAPLTCSRRLLHMDQRLGPDAEDDRRRVPVRQHAAQAVDRGLHRRPGRPADGQEPVRLAAALGSRLGRTKVQRRRHQVQRQLGSSAEGRSGAEVDCHHHV